MKRNTIPAGTVTAAHGVRGELRVLPLRNRASYLLRLPELYLDGKPVRPVSARRHKQFVLLKLPGVEDMDAAEALRGKEITFARSAAPEAAYFEEELCGLRVRDGETGAALGVVAKVEDYPAGPVCTVEGEKTFLMPAVPGAFILSVNLEENLMDVRMWEGLADGGTVD